MSYNGMNLQAFLHVQTHVCINRHRHTQKAKKEKENEKRKRTHKYEVGREPIHFRFEKDIS